MNDRERITRLEIRCEQLQLTVNEAFHWIDILKSDLSDLQDKVGYADRKTEPTMRLHEWTSDDITFCTAKCEVKCFRKPKYIKHKDIPHSFSDFSNSCVEYEPKDEPQTERSE